MSLEMQVAYKLNHSICPHHKSDSNHVCEINESGEIEKFLIYGSDRNYLVTANTVHCCNRKSRKYNVLRSMRRFQIKGDDYIKTPIDICFIKQGMVTAELYEFCNFLALTEPGLNPGNWRTRIKQRFYNRYQELYRENRTRFKHNELNKYVDEQVIDKKYLFRIEEDIVYNLWREENKMDEINYRMGGNSIMFDWTFQSGQNTYDKFDAEHEKDEMKTKYKGINLQRQCKNAWFVCKNDSEMILSMKPTPKTSEKQHYSIPEITDNVEGILSLAEKQVRVLVFFCDGLKANVAIPLKVADTLIQRNGNHLNGYNLLEFVVNLLVCTVWLCAFSL